MVAGFAEANRAPFDLPEADAELVAGYQTEYGGMRFGSFMLAEYIEMFVDLRDRRRPSSSAAGWAPAPAGSTRSGCSQDLGLIFFFIWVRATLPRLRYDQLMTPRLEGAAAARDAEHARHRDPRDRQ